MSEQTNKTNVVLDQWVQQVISDPANARPLEVLCGFIGSSAIENHIRVYADIALNTFVEVSLADVHHSRQRTAQENPDGGSFLWVSKISKLQHAHPKPVANAGLFEGNIQQQHGGSEGEVNAQWDWPTRGTTPSLCATCGDKIHCGPYPPLRPTVDPCTTNQWGCKGKPQQEGFWNQHTHPYNFWPAFQPPVTHNVYQCPPPTYACQDH